MIAPVTDGERTGQRVTDGHGSERFVASSHVVDCPLADGFALLDTRTSSYFTLNRSAALLWNLAREPVTFDALRAAFARSFGRSEAAVTDDVRGAVDQLVGSGLFQRTGCE